MPLVGPGSYYQTERLDWDIQPGIFVQSSPLQAEENLQIKESAGVLTTIDCPTQTPQPNITEGIGL